MDKHRWVNESAAAVTVCDTEGIIIEMNDIAAKLLRKHGGKKLVGSNLMDCHPEPAKTKLKQLMEKQQTNIYTIEKNGINRLIYQAPWYVKGKYSGFVEISFIVPADMPHIVRDSK